MRIALVIDARDDNDYSGYGEKQSPPIPGMGFVLVRETVAKSDSRV